MLPQSVLSDNILVSFPGRGSEASFPVKNDIDLNFDGRQREDIELTVEIFLATPRLMTPLGRIWLIEYEEAKF
jgi:hypothetical protein